MYDLIKILKGVFVDELCMYISTEDYFKYLVFKIINTNNIPKNFSLDFLIDFDLYIKNYPRGRHSYEWGIMFKERNGGQFTEYSINDKVLGDIVTGIREYNIDNILND